jgi:hypothetical protein
MRGSRKKIKRDKDVAEKRRKIIPLKLNFKEMIEPTFVKASMNSIAETIGFPGMTLRDGEDGEAGRQDHVLRETDPTGLCECGEGHMARPSQENWRATEAFNGNMKQTGVRMHLVKMR